AGRVAGVHPSLGEMTWAVEGKPEVWFTENETNLPRLHRLPGGGYCKDAFHEAFIAGNAAAVNPCRVGTTAAAVRQLTLAPGAEEFARVRLQRTRSAVPFAGIDAVMPSRQQEANVLYGGLQRDLAAPYARLVQRRAFAGMLWTKQFSH